MWPQWTSMLAGWQWTLLAAVPPAIIALYFLKLRREPREVSSTYLWQKSLEDLHVNSLWQRLRQSLLLLLQLAIIALVMLALLRPSWRGDRLEGDRFIFLVDNSASMSATDVAPSRLEEAKRQVERLIDQMDSGDVAMLVSFADRAQIEQAFTTDRRALRRSLAAIRPTQRRTSLDEALRVASGLANPGRSGDISEFVVAEARPAKLYLFTDGRIDEVKDFSLGNLEPVYVPIGSPEARNIGIVAFSGQPAEERPDRLQVFARLSNFGPEDETVSVELHLDGEMIDADQATIAAGESQGVVFELDRIESGVLELRILADDHLALDDRAFVTISAPEPARVLCITPGNDPLRLALVTERARQIADVSFEPPAFLETDDYRRQAAGRAYDLILYDRCAPETMPQASTLFIGAAPPQEGWSLAEEVVAPQIIDTESSHPLMQLIELGDVRVVKARPATGPPGGVALITSHLGPLLSIAPRDEFEDAVLAFELVGADGAGTDWPVRLSFPVFALNVLRYLGGHVQAETAAATLRPGDSVTLRLDAPAKELEVVTPARQRVGVGGEGARTVHFSATNELGVYDLLADGDVRQQFPVNLFDPAESDIRTINEELRIGDVRVTGQAAAAVTRREGWKWLLLAALGVLIVEWSLFTRRVNPRLPRKFAPRV